MHIHLQSSRFASPWSFRRRFCVLIWEFVWALFCSWTPKPCNFWRILILRCFGATIYGTPFVHQRARIDHPWNLTLHHKACLGDRAHAYCLASVVIGSSACIAQEAYLCTGTHNFSDPSWPLLTAPIFIHTNAFIGCRAFLLPGVRIGKNSIVGACSVVTRDVSPLTTVVGNPARPVS